MDDRIKFSRQQEKEVAKQLNGKVVTGSGNGDFNGGDVLLEDWFLECKTVISEKKSYAIKRSVLDKMMEQAFEQQKDKAALLFRFEPKGEDWVVLDIDTFENLLEEIKQLRRQINTKRLLGD